MKKEFGRIKKSDAIDIVIRVDEYEGKEGITIREFVTSDKYTGFTKNGTRIPIEKLDEFKKIISSIEL
jgi:hypothetical protein